MYLKADYLERKNLYETQKVEFIEDVFYFGAGKREAFKIIQNGINFNTVASNKHPKLPGIAFSVSIHGAHRFASEFATGGRRQIFQVKLLIPKKNGTEENAKFNAYTIENDLVILHGEFICNPNLLITYSTLN
jgi:hypothetical protein